MREFWDSLDLVERRLMGTILVCLAVGVLSLIALVSMFVADVFFGTCFSSCPISTWRMLWN